MLGDATVAAWLTWPTSGVHGVHSPSHSADDSGENTPVKVMSAERNLAPNVAPPFSTGMSGGARQKTSCVEPIAAAGPSVGMMYAGGLMVCPAAERTSRYVAIGAAAPMQLVCDAAGTVPGAATMMSPASGSSAPPRARALTCAFTVPTFVPGAALGSIVVPGDTT